MRRLQYIGNLCFHVTRYKYIRKEKRVSRLCKAPGLTNWKAETIKIQGLRMNGRFSAFDALHSRLRPFPDKLPLKA